MQFGFKERVVSRINGISYKQMEGRSVRTRKTDRVNEVIVKHGSTVWFIREVT